MKIPLISILIFVISCRNGINIKTSDNTKDTLHFQNELTNSEDSLPLQGEGKIISLFKLDSFCINKKYSYDGLQDIELITNQEKFEEIAEREYPNKNKMPMIDFSKNYLLALVIANKKPKGMGLRGFVFPFFKSVFVRGAFFAGAAFLTDAGFSAFLVVAI